MAYSIVHVDEIEPAGPGGAVRFVRRELGVEAFGINWFELGPNVAGREHDETATGQEEVTWSSRVRASIASMAKTCPYAPDRSSVSTRRRHVCRSPARGA